MPIIYEISYGGDLSRPRCYTSKEAAVKAARAEIDEGVEGPLDIDRIEMVPLTLPNVLAIIESDGGSYSLSRETIQTVTRGSRKAAPPAAPIDTTHNAARILVETVNGREIKKYLNIAGRVIYAVGGVGFYHLDEARIYAKGSDDPPPAH